MTKTGYVTLHHSHNNRSICGEAVHRCFGALIQQNYVPRKQSVYAETILSFLYLEHFIMPSAVLWSFGFSKDQLFSSQVMKVYCHFNHTDSSQDKNK